MKVFISWSGERSRYVAEALRNWLPDVIQAVRPWMSEVDIGKGARWGPTIDRQLEEARMGIVCLTPENQKEPWILFETGALSAKIKDGERFVCAFVIDMEKGDVEPPLGQFQGTKASDKEDVRQLIQTVNNALGDGALDAERLNASFERCWQDLEMKIRKMPPPPPGKGHQERDLRPILEEILEMVRGMERRYIQEQVRHRAIADALRGKIEESGPQPTNVSGSYPMATFLTPARFDPFLSLLFPGVNLSGAPISSGSMSPPREKGD